MTDAIDVARARRDTPGCATVLHFNNAGMALSPDCVLDAIVEHTRREGAIGGYEAAAEADEKVEHTYDALAALLHCDRTEVAVVENATRAWDMAFYAIPFQRGDRILTGRAEYASNYIAFLQVARRTGAEIEAVPSEPSGQISVTALEEALRRDGRVKLVAMTHVPTNGGLVNPAAEVGRRARAAGALFLLDACQSAGQRPLDVRELQCDMLSATGRKYLRGPRGTGFLYVRRDVLERLEPPFLDLHAATWTAADRYEVRGDARRFENWEGNVAAKIGLGVAVDYALGWGLPAIQARVDGLARLLRERLAAVPGATVRDIGTDRCGIVTFTLDGRDPAAVRDALSARRMNTTITQAAATRLDMDARGLRDMVRASVHYYNTEEEIDRFVAAVAAL
jgi:cysteine desulfurase / selenocysteine lyase